jgi:hypothetical protein
MTLIVFQHKNTFFGATTFSITTISKMAFSIIDSFVTLSIKTLCIVTLDLSIKCHYVESRYAECHNFLLLR